MKRKKRTQMSDMKEFWHSYRHNPTWKLANTISFGTIRKIGGFKVVRTKPLKLNNHEVKKKRCYASNE
jgi:hypothetical protein